MNPTASISGAVNALSPPRASLSSCVRAILCRNARGIELDAWQRLSDRVERAVPGDADRDGK